jgi:hypothetical protein
MPIRASQGRVAGYANPLANENERIPHDTDPSCCPRPAH